MTTQPFRRPAGYRWPLLLLLTMLWGMGLAKPALAATTTIVDKE